MRARPRPSAPRAAVLHAVVSAVVVAVLTASAALVWSIGLARDEARTQAEGSAQRLVETVVGPLVTPELLAGDPAAWGRLDGAVEERMRDGSITRVKLWDGTGTVLYSDEPRLVGQHFPADDSVAVATTSEISGLLAEEHVYERVFPRLAEVYVPMGQVAGRDLVFEAYFPVHGLPAHQVAVAVQLAVLGVGGVALLLLLLVPQTLLLARRAERDRWESTLLRERVESVREEERRRIADGLRAGVVQDLAGVGYVLDSLEESVDPPVRDMLQRASQVLRDDISRLRLIPDGTAERAAAPVAAATSPGAA